MYKVFDTLQEYNQFTNDGANLTAGVIYYVNEDGSTHFQTNNIDGEEKVYDMIDGIPEGYIVPSGNISITENGENINVNEYATASVNVPIPEGYIVPSGNKEITQNGTNIDIAQYATASVNVAPNLTTQNITENGTYQPSGNYDGFSSVTVNVDAPAKDYIIEGAVYDPTETYSGAFTGNTYIKSVTIPEGFTSIGSAAFQGYSSLTSINIPDSVTSIGDFAFNLCSSLTSINIPDGVTSIGQSTFQDCSSLTSINILDGVTSIGQSALRDCTSLTIINIPDSVTSIGDFAFYNSNGLTSITIQATTPPTLGGKYAFVKTNNCPIYVPAESVDAYKTATNWSSLSDRITAIVA